MPLGGSFVCQYPVIRPLGDILVGQRGNVVDGKIDELGMYGGVVNGLFIRRGPRALNNTLLLKKLFLWPFNFIHRFRIFLG